MEVEFVDAEEKFTGKETYSFKEIVMTQLSRITQLSSKEFKPGGYWEERPVIVGGSVYLQKSYVEDGRLAYINGVDVFGDLLLGKFDKIMKEEIKKLELEETKSFEEIKRGGGDKDKWINTKLKIKRKLFQQLCLLLGREGYLEISKIKEV